MKKLIVLFVLLLYGACFGNPHGLIAHYKLNDNADSNIVVDSTGVHNGTFTDATGDPNTDAHAVAGKINGALTFDGTDDYIDCNNAFESTLQDEFSVSFWLYDSGSGVDYILGTEKTSSDTGFEIYVRTNGTRRMIYTYKINGDDITNLACAAVTITQNTWQFITLTVQQVSSAVYIRLYVNGVWQDTSALDPLTLSDYSNSYNIFIGDKNVDGANSGELFTGSIDNVMIFNKELSADEVKRLYNNGHGTEIIADLDESRRIRRRIL